MHDSMKVMMGTTRSTYKEGATSYPVSDVADFPAGTVARLGSNGFLSKTSGRFIGVSLGSDLSAEKRIVVLSAGLKVPVLIESTDVPVVGETMYVDNGLAAAQGGSSLQTNAYYTSTPLIGIAEDGSEVNVALIDYVGGL